MGSFRHERRPGANPGAQVLVSPFGALSLFRQVTDGPDTATILVRSGIRA